MILYSDRDDHYSQRVRIVLAEGIYQSNINNINMMFKSGVSKVSKGQCISRNLPLWKISTDTTNPL